MSLYVRIVTATVPIIVSGVVNQRERVNSSYWWLHSLDSILVPTLCKLLRPTPLHNQGVRSSYTTYA